jgi:hypothetical protein
VLDNGFNLNHDDIRFWKNTNEIPNNGIDDDNNGYIDDYHGWNGITQTGVIPLEEHGLNVAGVIGAIGNNNKGISGVNWNVKILPVIAWGVYSSLTEDVVIEAYGYVYTMRKLYNETNGLQGAFIVATNSSFGIDNGDPDDFPYWCTMYDKLGSIGILSCAAAPNANVNVDIVGDMPTTCSSEFLISVTNTTSNDFKHAKAGYGVNSIDIGAPGTNIYTTSHIYDNGYISETGTSLASPQVAGVIALMYAAMPQFMIQAYKSNPANFALLVKQYLLDGTDRIIGLNGWIASGRLNAYKALRNTKCYSDFPILIGGTINSSTTWLNPIRINSIITIPRGITLTIKTQIMFGSNAKIIVQPGGKLIVDGGTLTGMCNSSWKGVEVWGTREQTVQSATYHGIVQLSNGAVIENAEYGIYVGANTTGAYQLGYGGGGIVYANDATFRNNKEAVYYREYTRKNSSGTETANLGYFTNCNFIKDNNAFLESRYMVYLTDVRDIKFNGCVFNNTSTQNTYGIAAINSSVRMDRSNVYPPYSPNPTSYKANSFSGFQYGIHTSNTPTKSNSIYYCDFSNCNTAFYGYASKNVKILSCRIDMTSNNSAIGVLLSSCSYYTIENNSFEGEGDKVGLNLRYGTEENNEIRCNTFTDLCTPVLIIGTNGSVANCTGVQVLCNHFEDNGTAIHVKSPNGIMRPLQGSSSAGAGNRFINPVVSFHNAASVPMTYYWNSNFTEQYPARYNTNNLTVQSTNAAHCPKGIGYQGDWYYLYVVVPPGGGFEPGEPGLASLSISYAEQQELLTAKQTVYKQRYANKKIDLNAVKSGNLNDPQVSSYLELADISESVSSICREAFRIIFEDTVFDRNEFHTWLQRENTLRSYYTLAESYVEISDWANAKKTLDKIPVFFPDYNKTQHQYYETCLSLQYQWKDKERSEISQKEIRLLENMLIGNDEEGIASAKARGMWDWIHDTITTTCPFPEGLCSRTTEEIAIQGKTQKSMGEDNPVMQDGINNDLISVNIYPNPARNTVFISLDKMPETSVYYQFYDIQGKELQSGNFSNQKQELDISAISKGIYFISVTVENQSRITKKVVKE